MPLRSRIVPVFVPDGRLFVRGGGLFRFRRDRDQLRPAHFNRAGKGDRRAQQKSCGLKSPPAKTTCSDTAE